MFLFCGYYKEENSFAFILVSEITLALAVSGAWFVFQMHLQGDRTDLAIYWQHYGVRFLAEIPGDQKRSHLFMVKELKATHTAD